MSKLYIFGIGGTGSRVLKAMTMLMASGVRIGQHEIVPIIIDPDKSNADMTRTVQLMDNYIKIHKNLTFAENNPNCFFRVGLEKSIQNFNIPIKDTDNLTFRDYINLQGMSRENQALIKMLFSDANLDSSMDIGFKGNPNIGSVVLNQVITSDEFRSFANSFEQGDKIFIISSIFGGTGASGFPLLVKTLRTGNNFPNFALINDAEIGAVTLLPYFRIKKDLDCEIDSTTFISKSKSALSYYENNLIGNNQVNAIYYLGDTITDNYDACDGGEGQENKAHLIELLAATAIVDFSLNQFDINSSVNKELGIKDIADTDSLIFNSFHDGLKNMLMRPLIQFTLMSKFIGDKFDLLCSERINANREYDLDSQFYNSLFMNDLRDFVGHYITWLNEMSINKRQFKPFNLNCGDNPFTIVEGVQEKTGMFGSHGTFGGKFTEGINEFIGKVVTNNKSDKFMELFYRSTSKLVSDRLKIN